jgi:capsular polysaccharide biosynthesis protein
MGDRLMGDRRTTVRWTVLIVACTLVGALVGGLASRDIAPTYAANTAVLVGSLERSDLGSEFPTSAMVTAIYARLIRSGAVLEPVIANLGLATDTQELRDRVHVDVAPNEVPIITVTVYARTSAEALAIAGGITAKMQELRQTGASAGPAANDIQVLQPAEPLGGKIRPRAPVNVALGAMIGALVGLAALVVWTARRRRAAGAGSAAIDPWAAELGYAAHAR